jgi:hypothetical protein
MNTAKGRNTALINIYRFVNYYSYVIVYIYKKYCLTIFIFRFFLYFSICFGLFFDNRQILRWFMEKFIIFGKGGVEFYNNIFVCHKLDIHVVVFCVMQPQLTFH